MKGTDFDEGLIGANIHVVGTDNGVLTNIDGDFCFDPDYNLADSTEIEFSYTRYEPLRLKASEIKNKTIGVMLA